MQYRYFTIILLMLISINALAQDEITFQVTEAKIKLAKLAYGKELSSQPIKMKKVLYPSVQIGEVPSQSYLDQQKEVNRYKDIYDDYTKKVTAEAQRQAAMRAIISNIEVFLQSKAKQEDKIHLLQTSDSLINLHKLEWQISQIRPGMSDYRLYIEGKKPQKSYLKQVQTILATWPIHEHIEPREVQIYLSKLEALNTMPKTTRGETFVNDFPDKEVRTIVPDTIILPNGRYTMYGEYYNLVQHDHPRYAFVELLSDSEIRNMPQFLVHNMETLQTGLRVVENDDNQFFLIHDDTFLQRFIADDKLKSYSFTLVPSTIQRLDYLSKVSTDEQFVGTLNKKKMNGLFLLNTLDSDIDYSSMHYIPFSQISSTDRFILLTNSTIERDMDAFVIIQNVTTSKYYVLNNFVFNHFQDFKNMGNKENGYGHLIKPLARELTASEKQIRSRLLRLAGQGSAKCDEMETIAQRILMARRRNVTKVPEKDRLRFNALYRELRAIDDSISDIRRYEDSNKYIEDSLSDSDHMKINTIKRTIYNSFEL